MVVYKICSKCKTEKPLAEFYYNIHMTTRDKRETVCRECRKLQRIHWREQHPEIYEEQRRKARERQKSEIYQKKKLAYQNANREKCRAACRESYYKNIEKYKYAAVRICINL